MKRFLFLLLAVALATWGTMAIAYAHKPTPDTQTFSHPTPTPLTSLSLKKTPTPQPTIIDIAATVPPQVQPGLYFHGSSAHPQIALTFDDGPNPTFTPQVLTILQHYHIHATFFCIGGQIQAYPALVQQEQQAGDIVGNHSWSHPDLTKLTPAEITQQLRATSTLIQQTTGTKPTFFRPPYGAVNETVKSIATQLGLSIILWNVDPRDWVRPGSDVIVQRVLSTIQNGSIILLHDGGGNRWQTIQALPTIITTLQQRGFTFVTLPQLLTPSQSQATSQPASSAMAKGLADAKKDSWGLPV